jgi:hypothetical protein
VAAGLQRTQPKLSADTKKLANPLPIKGHEAKVGLELVTVLELQDVVQAVHIP